MVSPSPYGPVEVTLLTTVNDGAWLTVTGCSAQVVVALATQPGPGGVPGGVPSPSGWVAA